MPPSRRLSAVKPGTRSRRATTVKAAAESGSRRELLTVLRSRIAAAIDSPDTHPRDISPLSRRLLEIAEELELLDAADRGDDIGEAAATPDQEWASS